MIEGCVFFYDPCVTRTLEEQAKGQGLTLGPCANRLEKLRRSIECLWRDDIVSDSERFQMYEKLDAIVKENVSPLMQ